MQERPPAPNQQRLSDQIREIQEEVRASVEERVRASTDEQAGAPLAPGQTQATTTVPPPLPEIMIPREAVEITTAFLVALVFIVVGFPIARAIGRWIDRRGAPPAKSPEVSAQLAQLSQSVEAVAIEVERITEGQRFTTKLLADMQAKRGTLLGAENPAPR